MWSVWSTRNHSNLFVWCFVFRMASVSLALKGHINDSALIFVIHFTFVLFSIMPRPLSRYPLSSSPHRLLSLFKHITIKPLGRMPLDQMHPVARQLISSVSWCLRVIAQRGRGSVCVRRNTVRWQNSNKDSKLEVKISLCYDKSNTIRDMKAHTHDKKLWCCTYVV